MVDGWERIAGWCQEHAPQTAAAIRTPATTEMLEWAQRESGSHNWPESVLAFYAWCDGTDRSPAGYLWPGFRPLSLREVVDSWRTLMRISYPRTAPSLDATEDDLSEGFGQQVNDLHATDKELDAQGFSAGTPTHRFIPQLLPVAEDQSGSFLVCDRRWKPRNQHGCIAEFDRVEGYDRTPPWRSLATLAARTAAALPHGRVVSGSRSRPLAVGGRLTWSTTQGDPIDDPHGATIELALAQQWIALPGTDLEVSTQPIASGVQLRYRRAESL